MGRFRKKNKNFKERRDQPKKQNVKEEYETRKQVLENKAFEAFYRFTLKEEFPDESDFQRFLITLRQKLPVTFRINEDVPNIKNFLNKISHPNFVAQMTTQHPDNQAKAKEGEIVEEKKEEKPKAQEGNFDNEELEFEIESEQMKLKNVPWYPRDLVWELATFRHELKRNKAYEKLHKFIQQANDSGLLTRQELVSMLPPLLLDVQSTDIIFDMCAAPGSKTSQLLELLYREEFLTGKVTEGGVVANDVDTARANMLIHQVQRISTAGMMVINHHAQYFPTLKAEGEASLGQNNRFYFDKLLVDVPCTGDGAIRKIPRKWQTWTARDGISLHGLQLQILMRALQLAKIGGLILYSTCSINPVEDEAVVTELFRRCNSDAFELLPIQDKVPGLITRKGLVSWPVLEPKEADSKIKEEKKEGEEEKKNPEDFFNIYESFDQLPKDYDGLIRATMFPDSVEKMRDVYKIENTVRLMPHDQNTGGFYLALIRKKNHVVFGGKGLNTSKVWNKNEGPEQAPVKVDDAEEMEAIKTLGKDVDEKEALKHSSDAVEETKQEAPKKAEKKEKESTAIVEEGTEQKEKKDKKEKKEKKEIFVPMATKDWESIRDYYGADERLRDLLIQQSHGEKKVYLISAGIKKILDLDRSKGLLLKLNTGVKAFSKNKETFHEHNCVFRLCQDAVSQIFPHITKKKVKCSEEEFKFFIQNSNVRYVDIANEELRNRIQAEGQGSIVLYTEKEGNVQDLDCIVCLTHATSITPMTSRELINSLKIRYLE